MAQASPGGTQPPFPADDDLVLVAEDGNIYWLKKAVYMDKKFRVSRSGRLADQVDELSSQGVLLADVKAKEDHTLGVGAACFVVNLRGIRHQSAKSTDSSMTSSPSEPRTSEDEEPLQAGEGDEGTEGLPS